MLNIYRVIKNVSLDDENKIIEVLLCSVVTAPFHSLLGHIV